MVALSGPPLRMTLAKMAENALRAEVERLKKENTISYAAATEGMLIYER